MKLLTSLLSLLLATSVAADSSWFGASQQTTLDDKVEVPGSNPLVFCDDPKDYILKIDKVDLEPNPPEPGKNLTISATGTLKETIEKGAKVRLAVKYGLIQIINQEVDLCDQTGKVDLECPLEKGDMEMEKVVMLPKEIPPGKYTVLADVTTKDGDKITCLEATMAFTRGDHSRM